MNLVILEMLVPLVNVVIQEKRVIEVMLAHKVILVVLAKLVHQVVMVKMVFLVKKVKKVNQHEFQLCKVCPEKKVHLVFLV